MANITVVVTGGIRAPSALDLQDRFLADGHQVRILASRNALRFLWAHLLRRPARIRRFLGHFRPHMRETFAYFAQGPVGVPHVAEGKWADVAVIVPATCSSLGKLVSGISDNYPTLVVRAIPRTKKVIVVPSMNPEMWFDPFSQRNIDLLNATEKYQVVCPSRGQMACGDFGFGAQASFEDIVAETYRALGIDQVVETALQGPRASVPSAPDAEEESAEAMGHVVIVDEDRALRDQIADLLRRSCPQCSVQQFECPTAAKAWLRRNDAAVVLTELAFADGTSGVDIIDLCRRSGWNQSMLVASSKDRREAEAERLARQDVHFLPKPLNVPYAVCMIVGLLGGLRQQPLLRTRNLAIGEILFREGDPGAQVYLLNSGSLKITKMLDGREVAIRTVYPGEMIGEMAFFDRSKRFVTSTALETSELAIIDVDQFYNYFDRQPIWLRRMIDTLLDRLRDLTEHLAVAKQGTAHDSQCHVDSASQTSA